MKTFFLLFIVVFFFTDNLFSQPVLTFTKNGHKAGTKVRMVKFDYDNPGKAGGKQLWNFSRKKGLGLIENKIDTVSCLYKGWFVGDVVVELKESDFRFFFDTTRDSLFKIGYSYENPDTIVRFTSPVLSFVYPIEYKQSANGVLGGKYYIDKKTTAFISGDYSFEADGWGDIILPDRTKVEDVLRVKSIENIYSLSKDDMDTLFLFSNVSYKWYSSSIRYPVLSCSKTDLKTKRNKFSSKSGFYQVGFTVSDEPIDYRVKSFYKMPDITFKYSLDYSSIVKCRIYDNQGNFYHVMFEEFQFEGDYERVVKRFTLPEEVIGGKIVLDILDFDYQIVESQQYPLKWE